jgi:nicotinate-nucleotide adenylyltransferase
VTPRAARAVRAGERIGLFGGSFDPPHFGHLALAEWARLELALDRVVFIPAGEPPHKRGTERSSIADRVAMTRLAVKDHPAFEVSTLEARRKGPSYTADTVRAFAARWPGARLHFLMGADMFATFDSWREPEVISELAVLVVAIRPGSKPPRRNRWTRRGAGVVWLSNPGLEVSSSVLRERAAAGWGTRYLVPDAVERYAARRALYVPVPRRTRRTK